MTSPGSKSDPLDYASPPTCGNGSSIVIEKDRIAICKPPPPRWFTVLAFTVTAVSALAETAMVLWMAVDVPWLLRRLAPTTAVRGSVAIVLACLATFAAANWLAVFVWWMLVRHRHLLAKRLDITPSEISLTDSWFGRPRTRRWPHSEVKRIRVNSPRDLFRRKSMVCLTVRLRRWKRIGLRVGSQDRTIVTRLNDAIEGLRARAHETSEAR